MGGGISLSFTVVACLGIYGHLINKSKAQPGYFCTKREVIRTNRISLCNKLFENFSKTEAQLDIVKTAELHKKDPTDPAFLKQVKQWVYSDESTGECVFFNISDKVVVDCCPGYEGDNCDQAICTPACVNGNCASPSNCVCDDGYTGIACIESKSGITDKEAYCYTTDSCDGFLVDDMDEVTSYSDCCAQGGKAWGLYGSDMCNPCLPVDATKDDQIEKDLDTPSFIPKDPTSPFHTCFSYGPNYYRTFDSLEYLFAGRCSYTVFTDGVRIVEVTMIECHKYSACKKKLTIKLNSAEIVEAMGHSITYNDEDISDKVTMSYGWSAKDSGVIIETKGTWYYLVYGTLRVRWDNDNTWLLTLEESINAEGSNTFRGLCGNMDGDPFNDMRQPNNMIVGNPTVFGNSWKKYSDINICPDAPDNVYNCKDAASERAAMKACSPLHGEPFSECHEEVLVRHYYLRCINDYCGVINYYATFPDRNAMLAEYENDLQAAICSSFSAYCMECATRKIAVEFRTTDLCPKECPAGLQYSDAVPKCPRTCHNINSILPADCLNEFYPGCQCPKASVMHDDRCIPGDECPCYHQKESYVINSVIKTLCNTCTCRAGRWECTKMACAKTCSVIGNQHFTTFDRKMFVYHGGDGCQYILTQLREGEDRSKGLITVVYRVYDCTGIDVMCAKSVDVIYENDGKTTHVKLHDDFSATINEVEYDNLRTQPFTDRYIYVKTITSLFTIIRGFGFKVLYAPLGRVYLVFDPYYINKLQGLCGNNDNKQSNDYMTSNGIETTDVESFGDSWVYGDCTNTPPGNSKDNPCSIRNIVNSVTNLCENVGRQDIFGACRNIVEYQKFQENCKYDMCARQNVNDNNPVCIWIVAMARACKEYGIIINWMANEFLAGICSAYQCNGDQMYHECASVCGSCSDRQMDAIYCETECEAGCTCPDGELLDDYGNCVTVDKCTCYDKYDLADKIKKPEAVSNRGCSCVCEKGLWICEEKNNCSYTIKCPNNQVYLDDYSKCNNTCSNYNKPCTDYNTYEGCGCEEGLILDNNGMCIEPAVCPCLYDGEWYDRGDEVQIGCKTFECKDRRWVKQNEQNCSYLCWAAGDAQYMTFDQFFFTFPGKCEYYLIKNENLMIQARNIKCGIMGITCMKALIIMANGMRFEYNKENELIFEGQSYKLDADGSVDITSGIYFRKSGLFRTIYLESVGLLIQHDSGTRVYIQLDRKWRSKIDGLCGNFDGIADNELGDIVGTTVEEWGNSWKTENDAACPDVEPGKQTKCEQYPERVEWARSFCGLITSGSLFAECRKYVTEYETTYYKACLYDACSCNKGGDCECLCTALANFVEACHRAGIIVHWRSQKLCPIMCPPGLEYKSCGPGCPQSCKNIGDEPVLYCKKLICVEGCFCPEGEYMHGGKCVSSEDCPCEVDSVKYPPGTMIQKDCQMCTCINSKFDCTGDRCNVTTCDDDHFVCDGHHKFHCLRKDFICDGVVDCPNGIDEYNCSFDCAAGEYKCYSSRTCIPGGYVCDGYNDCLDGSDEHLCPPLDCTDERFFACDNGRCIPNEFTCDGKYDCGIRDFSDEEDCPEVTDCPATTRFRCFLTGACLPNTVVCDGHDDCGDGSDEKDCATTPTPVLTTTAVRVTTTFKTPGTTTFKIADHTDTNTPHPHYFDVTTAAEVCPPDSDDIILTYTKDGFTPMLVGPSEDTASPRDGLVGSHTFLDLCKGDFYMFKPVCPEKNQLSAEILYVSLMVQFVHKVKITYVGPLGTVTTSKTIYPEDVNRLEKVIFHWLVENIMTVVIEFTPAEGYDCYIVADIKIIGCCKPVSQCPPDEMQIFLDDKNRPLVIVPEGVLYEAGMVISTRDSIVISSPWNNDPFRVMDIGLTVKTTAFTEIYLTLDIADSPVDVKILAAIFPDSNSDIVYRSTGAFNDLPENGQENVLSITITFNENVQVSNVFVRGCNEAKTTLKTTTDIKRPTPPRHPPPFIGTTTEYMFPTTTELSLEECPEGYTRVYANYGNSHFDIDIVPNNNRVVEPDKVLEGGTEIDITPADVIEIIPENFVNVPVLVQKLFVTVQGAGSSVEVQFYDDSDQLLPNPVSVNPFIIIVQAPVSLQFRLQNGVPDVAKIIFSFTGTEDITVSKLFIIACGEGKEPECPLGYMMEMIDFGNQPFNIMFMPGDNDVTPEDILLGSNGGNITSDETIVIKPTTNRGEMIVLDVSLDVKGPANLTVRIIFTDSITTEEQFFTLGYTWDEVVLNVPAGGFEPVKKIEIDISTSYGPVMIRNLFVRACNKPLPSTTVTFRSTFTTTASDVCVFSMDVFIKQFGKNPDSDVIGWIEKDNDYGLTSPEEEVRIGDSIEPNDVVHVGCNNCTCDEDIFIICTNEPCPTDCVWDTWGQWSDCTQDCDIGIRAKYRDFTPPTEGGKRCIGDFVDVEFCNEFNCPVDCIWNTWSSWSDCSVSCGSGVQERRRTKKQEAYYNGKKCEGSFVEQIVCNRTCPECPNGKELNLHCTCKETCLLLGNPNSCVEPEECEERCECPDGYVENSEGECVKPTDCPCIDIDDKEYKQGQTFVTKDQCEKCICDKGKIICSDLPNCDCIWGIWSPWSDCTVTCGIGVQRSMRTIEQPARGDGECEGDDKIERECQKPECPVCEIDGVVYHPTEFIKSLSNECKNCYCDENGEVMCDDIEIDRGDELCKEYVCVDGEKAVIDLSENCDEECPAGYVRVPKATDCCYCKPLIDIHEGCTLTKTSEVIRVVDTEGNECRSEQPVVVTYCNGSCPSFDMSQIVFVRDNNRYKALSKSSCECCTGTGSRYKVDVVCPGNMVRRLDILQFTRCECRDCRANTERRKRGVN